MSEEPQPTVRCVDSVLVLCLFLWYRKALGSSAGAAPPNILIMLTDDQGWGDNEYNCENSTGMCARTPNIAALAADPVRVSSLFLTKVH